MGQPDRSYIVPLRKGGHKRPLFCFHGGGGHLLEYREMAKAMPSDQPLYGIRASNMDSDQKATGVEELAERYLVMIRQVQEEGPYHLCGLSFGGLLAYEVATKLAIDGQEVGFVALLDTVNPAYYRNLSTARFLRFFVDVFIARSDKYFRSLISGDAIAIGRFVREFLVRRISALLWKTRMRVARTTGRAVAVALHDNVRIFGSISKSYSPKMFSGKLAVFRAANGWAEYRHEPALGWDSVVQGGVEVHVIPGDHLTMMEMPNVLDLVKHLSYLLDGAE
jgi:thioesterase domain-containing protein